MLSRRAGFSATAGLSCFSRNKDLLLKEIGLKFRITETVWSDSLAPSASAAAVTAPGRPRHYFTSYPSVSVKICSSVAGVVSCPLAAGLRQCNTRRRFIASLVTAVVSDERRRSANLFLVKVPAHHSAPSLAALAESSRADCI